MRIRFGPFVGGRHNCKHNNLSRANKQYALSSIVPRSFCSSLTLAPVSRLQVPDSQAYRFSLSVIATRARTSAIAILWLPLAKFCRAPLGSRTIYAQGQPNDGGLPWQRAAPGGPPQNREGKRRGRRLLRAAVLRPLPGELARHDGLARKSACATETPCSLLRRVPRFLTCVYRSAAFVLGGHVRHWR